MSRHADSFTVELSPDDAIWACRTAIDRLGWKTTPSPPSRIVVEFPRTPFRWESKIEVVFAQAEVGTTVTLNGWIALTQKAALRKQMKQLRTAIEDASHIDRTVESVGESASANPSPDLALSVSESRSVGDPLEQMRKLGELRDAGVLTDAEFEAKKAELLKRI
jgi:hypothetical protein